MISAVCISFGVFPSFLATYLRPLSIGILFSSMPSTFQVRFRLHQLFFIFFRCVVVVTSINVKTSALSTSIIFYLLIVIALTEFNKSECFLLCERISFSFIRMFPVETLMEIVVLEFPCKWPTVCQNISIADNYSGSN